MENEVMAGTKDLSLLDAGPKENYINALKKNEAKILSVIEKGGQNLSGEQLYQMSEDYFHGIFEACKGVMQRVRDLSGLRTDGAELIQEAFASKRPLIAFNQLQSESEISEHKGISSLMLGCCQFLRNPRAHAPRILWHDETNVLEAMTFISMLHRVLDKCVQVPNGYCAADQNPTA